MVVDRRARTDDHEPVAGEENLPELHVPASDVVELDGLGPVRWASKGVERAAWWRGPHATVTVATVPDRLLTIRVIFIDYSDLKRME